MPLSASSLSSLPSPFSSPTPGRRSSPPAWRSTGRSSTAPRGGASRWGCRLSSPQRGSCGGGRTGRKRRKRTGKTKTPLRIFSEIRQDRKVNRPADHTRTQMSRDDPFIPRARDTFAQKRASMFSAGTGGTAGTGKNIPEHRGHPANQTIFCREYRSHHQIMHPGTAGTQHPSNGTATLSSARKDGPICPRVRSKAVRRPRLPTRTGGRYMSPSLRRRINQEIRPE
ncbi:hypothetical protein Metli_1662 [Methanofollis liminatans DSM 4140]|uniref:Uncharacterized protein n=1 Tax=Methanofollis liminatans DSM 4140 TaxID=28892 RepID=J1L4C7_9EURY|nr:hypothetical protein Metli_1662 [Methanofollis liminatans DSM 4140]